MTGCREVPGGVPSALLLHRQAVSLQDLQFPGARPVPERSRAPLEIPARRKCDGRGGAAVYRDARLRGVLQRGRLGGGHGAHHTAASVAREGALVTFSVTGSGFLYNMVRIMTGTRWRFRAERSPPPDIPAILAGRDRAAAGPTAPPHGLYLDAVFY